jgi:hypothetical protein
MMNKRFWAAFVFSTLLTGGAVQSIAIAEIGLPYPRPALPVPGVEYVSATRDGQTDQALFYFNIFGFGDRVANADRLVVGSSHAEFGISVAALSKHHGFNLALGGGEGLSFATTLLRRYNAHPALIALDPFSESPNSPSTEAALVLASTRAVAFHRVINIWAEFMRDWMLQGLLPRLTVENSGTKFEHPIGSVIIRDWETADVTKFYSSNGEVYSDPSKSHPLLPTPPHPYVTPKASSVILQDIKSTGAAIVVTLVPYPGFHKDFAKATAEELGARFVDLDTDKVRFFDFHHIDKASRGYVTQKLLEVEGN